MTFMFTLFRIFSFQLCAHVFVYVCLMSLQDRSLNFSPHHTTHPRQRPAFGSGPVRRALALLQFLHFTIIYNKLSLVHKILIINYLRGKGQKDFKPLQAVWVILVESGLFFAHVLCWKTEYNRTYTDYRRCFGLS